MRSGFKIIGTFLTLAIFCVMHLSCASSVKSAAVNEAGTFTRIMPGRAQHVSVVSQQAMDGLDLHVVDTHASQNGFVVVARDYHDKQVTITVEEHGPNASKVGVHVEPVEDQRYSVRVLDAISEQLSE